MTFLTKNAQKYFNAKFDCSKVTKEHFKENQGEYYVKIKTNYPNNTLIHYWAACPPNYNSSFTGSGLPFLNPDIAFDNTPNNGISKVKNGFINIQLYYPNSYYSNMGKKFIEPTIFYKEFSKKNKEIKFTVLKNSIPYRLCNYPQYPITKPRNSPIFYQNDKIQTISNQEDILRNTQYPYKNKYEDKFWGNKFPVF